MRKIIYIIFNVIITFFSSNKRTNIFLQQNFNKPIVAREKIENRCVYIYIYLRKQVWVPSCAWISIVRGAFDRLITGEAAKNCWTIKLWHHGGKDDEGYKVLRETMKKRSFTCKIVKTRFRNGTNVERGWYSL